MTVVIAFVLFHLCRGIPLPVTAWLREKMERDYLEAMGQTSGLHSMLLTAKMLQGKIKRTESPEKCLHKNDVELYFFSDFLMDDRQSNAGPVIVFLSSIPFYQKRFFTRELYLD